jgi:hypothetical protein
MEEENKVEESTEVKADSLSNREALQHALEVTQEKTAEAPTVKEVKAAVDADIEPPQGFSKEAQEAWRAKDYKKVNQEFVRLSQTRGQEVTRAQNAEREAREDAKKAREYSDAIKPYIEDRLVNEGVPKEKAALDAIKLAHALRTDRAAAKVELEKLGFVFAPDGAEPNKVDDSKITTLQERINALEGDKNTREYQAHVQLFEHTFSTLGSQKTRTGDPVYPGLLDESESGAQFARELGSLTKEPLFRQLVLRRIPNATHIDLVREAYIQLGGKIATDTVRVSKNNPQHIDKARRAAASSPGGTVSRDGNESLVGKLSNRAAMKKALEISQEH